MHLLTHRPTLTPALLRLCPRSRPRPCTRPFPCTRAHAHAHAHAYAHAHAHAPTPMHPPAAQLHSAPSILWNGLWVEGGVGKRERQGHPRASSYFRETILWSCANCTHRSQPCHMAKTLPTQDSPMITSCTIHFVPAFGSENNAFICDSNSGAARAKGRAHDRMNASCATHRMMLCEQRLLSTWGWY
jgi:hypothetical protein